MKPIDKNFSVKYTNEQEYNTLVEWAKEVGVEDIDGTTLGDDYFKYRVKENQIWTYPVNDEEDTPTIPFTEFCELAGINQNKNNMKNNLPKSYAVFNDGSEKFKKVFLPKFNEMYQAKCNGLIVGDYHGVFLNTKYGISSYKENFNTILTIDQFMELAEGLEIEGYICPEDYYGGDVKKGMVISEELLTKKEYNIVVKGVKYFFPSEIVEKWEVKYKEEPIIEVTMDEVAKKFGVDVSNLKIKK